MQIHKGQSYVILEGDVCECLARLADNSVQCVVTSPPYYGLRAYRTNPQIWDGDATCEHEWGSEGPCHPPGQVEQTKWKSAEAAGKGQTAGSGSFCSKCGAWKGELGLEPTPELYVQHMTEIFREVRRVLREDGTLWLNIGDSYWGGKGSNGSSKARRTAKDRGYTQPAGTMMMDTRPTDGTHPEIKPKDLIGIPWMLAFALRSDGWYLRQDIVWEKGNPMPESVTDRCTKNHEYVFLLTKSPKYYFDHEAIKEPTAVSNAQRTTDHYQTKGRGPRDGGNGGLDALAARMRSGEHTTRNRRSVWQVNTKPFKGAHFAVMPQALVEPCVLAGTSAEGCCSQCGSPYRRVMKKGDVISTGGSATGARATNMDTVSPLGQDPEKSAYNTGVFKQYAWETVGWEPDCSCSEPETRPCVVLDPFSGSGTVGVVALRHGQRYIGIELNPEYVGISLKRIEASLDARGHLFDVEEELCTPE